MIACCSEILSTAAVSLAGRSRLHSGHGFIVVIEFCTVGKNCFLQFNKSV